MLHSMCIFFFFNDTATTEIYTLSLHDALPIYVDRSLMDPLVFIDTDVRGTAVLCEAARRHRHQAFLLVSTDEVYGTAVDRKSTRLNSSHSQISYAVFCLKKKNTSIHVQRDLT